jgi:type II secretory pathway pseudopilin PulG
MTMLELLIVITLICIIAAFAVPRLMRARASANEASAIATLRAVSHAQDLYSSSCGMGSYAASLVVLGTPPPGSPIGFVTSELAAQTPSKSGYMFTLAAGAGSASGPTDCLGNPTHTSFYGTAQPTSFGVSGTRSFALGTDRSIWQTVGAAPPTEPFGPPATTIQ